MLNLLFFKVGAKPRPIESSERGVMVFAKSYQPTTTMIYLSTGLFPSIASFTTALLSFPLKTWGGGCPHKLYQTNQLISHPSPLSLLNSFGSFVHSHASGTLHIRRSKHTLSTFLPSITETTDRFDDQRQSRAIAISIDVERTLRHEHSADSNAQ